MEDKLTLLEVFDNINSHRNYRIVHTVHEFTSVCPKTGHPDFATMEIEYIPEKFCVELKSLKLYLQSFRNDGIFYENVTNRIADDLIGLLQPRYFRLTANFSVRGGLSSVVEVEHIADGFEE
ncbi:MAG: NADPH-dependent 7-cyano-7-deazaguanine reductase QueF [Ignavibacteriaceae bacterium]|nr:NADPH-dependent 7-cyano-7-deazaguanine reductase QueF [Ignavibacteriales bacterium]MBK7866351.1 NADPH-dependent 7-cyano-7-deazaguanine reductase QueF [Ignavibacteriales bacterium]MBP7542862.1 NADPH-dependent 7-cyano-7-deazaguanine reductase QueF [Ignavibacteriaceae bacterium]MBP9122131.1 NADPH-dependent 7-cyano-7-deazaguanine reductase QueF [Ignavibacteriaceae bacterium]MCC6637139.1 NADPH-dependent 7-cyano-7-deazaguanine reductase QueF [Ignavibacteriaceae bacterium]